MRRPAGLVLSVASRFSSPPKPISAIGVTLAEGVGVLCGLRSPVALLGCLLRGRPAVAELRRHRCDVATGGVDCALALLGTEWALHTVEQGAGLAAGRERRDLVGECRGPAIELVGLCGRCPAPLVSALYLPL